MNSPNYGSQKTLSAIGGGKTSRLCRFARRAALSSALTFAVTGNIPGINLIDQTTASLMGLPLLSSLNALAFAATLFFGCLYFGCLIVVQSTAQHQLRRLRKETESVSRTYLYLRSFDVTKSRMIDRLTELFDPRLSNLSPFTRVAHSLHDPEEELAQATAGFGLLIAIGDKRRSYGAAKIRTSDETWQSEFLRLADVAELIFVFPALTEGSKWELEQLLGRREYTEKTIFFMPRNSYFDEWHELRENSSRLLSIDLPQYDSRGAYFAIDASGKLDWLIYPETFIEVLRKQPTRQSLKAKLLTQSAFSNGWGANGAGS